ncbi:short-chain dehydrogenase [Pollutimonas nitritireducens]|uniref:Short-chain dehydrogenase n=1 Tax=Pollutimonas nitritireducens TaxID=2045209 RepID=A0A2N4UK15_9BURK|nr:SDR family oxidoreductase [Pollutimonas nitritireducens]PLC55363.1 short-chain dehydrogenase [Pollutimonas nitritireducens]
MKRVFITGASSGIGAALASFYAQQGAELGLVGRRYEALLALKNSLPGAHRVYSLDVRDRAALHAAARDFLAQGPVDVVIASAGISAGTLTEEPDDFRVFEAIIATNLNATVATFEPFIASMKQQRRGRLVGIASVAAVRGLPGAGAYSASKAAVRAYCESLRVELSQTGVKVITIAPGFIQTPMTAHNPYKMPFLMSADRFAALAGRAIERSVSYKVIPWQMACVATLLRLIPDRLYDYFAVRRERKPRLG